MPLEFAFTTAAMAAALEDSSVSYEDLADIEREFDDVETEISMYLFNGLATTAPLSTSQAVIACLESIRIS